MKNSPLFKWLCAVATEFVEGLADGFIIAAGGAQVAQISSATSTIRALTLGELAGSIFIAGVWYVAAFIKKNPPPFGQSEPVATPPPSSAT